MWGCGRKFSCIAVHRVGSIVYMHPIGKRWSLRAARAQYDGHATGTRSCPLPPAPSCTQRELVFACRYCRPRASSAPCPLPPAVRLTSARALASEIASRQGDSPTLSPGTRIMSPDTHERIRWSTHQRQLISPSAERLRWPCPTEVQSSQSWWPYATSSTCCTGTKFSRQ